MGGLIGTPVEILDKIKFSRSKNHFHFCDIKIYSTNETSIEITINNYFRR